MEFLLAFSLLLPLHAVNAQTIEQKLPAPVLTSGKPLMQTLNERRSVREFSSRPIDNQTLGEILWAAWGISHGGKHTIPTSMNKQDLKLYVVKADGAWIYTPQKHSLSRITDQDLRPILATQDYVKDAPLNLIYTGNDKKNSPLHAGSAYQNVGLYAASRGLNNVVRGYFDRNAVHKALELPVGEDVIISQTIGWSKE